MPFIAIITNTKNEIYILKQLQHIFNKEHIIFITDKNIDNMKNIHFETIVIDKKLKDMDKLRHILINARYVILNADITISEKVIENLKLMVISYGFQNKATFTISSVLEDNIIICLQRIMENIKKIIYEPQEIQIENEENIELNAIICVQIIKMIYNKIQILVD